jgi:phosphoglycerate dehydrogenase-like enzyme
MWMTKENPVIKVTSPSFSANKILRHELRHHFDNVIFNEKGERFVDDALKSYLADADAAIIGLEKIDVDVLRHCPNLKIISKYGVGLDSIDLHSCKERDVSIGWTSGVNKRSVSEMVLSFMIGLGRNMMQTSFEMRGGLWNKSGGFQLSGKTVGIIGVGHVGSDLIHLLNAFGCKILANDILDKSLLLVNGILICFRIADEIGVSCRLSSALNSIFCSKRGWLDSCSISFVTFDDKGKEV